MRLLIITILIIFKSLNLFGQKSFIFKGYSISYDSVGKPEGGILNFDLKIEKDTIVSIYMEATDYRLFKKTKRIAYSYLNSNASIYLISKTLDTLNNGMAIRGKYIGKYKTLTLKLKREDYLGMICNFDLKQLIFAQNLAGKNYLKEFILNEILFFIDDDQNNQLDFFSVENKKPLIQIFVDNKIRN